MIANNPTTLTRNLSASFASNDTVVCPILVFTVILRLDPEKDQSTSSSLSSLELNLAIILLHLLSPPLIPWRLSCCIYGLKQDPPRGMHKLLSPLFARPSFAFLICRALDFKMFLGILFRSRIPLIALWTSLISLFAL